MMDDDREMAVLRAAQLYYYENMTQDSIADRLGCTRWTVGGRRAAARPSGGLWFTKKNPPPPGRPHHKLLSVGVGI
ncbi:MAG: hypothetical protein ACWM0X_00050 [Schaalia turicensis]